MSFNIPSDKLVSTIGLSLIIIVLGIAATMLFIMSQYNTTTQIMGTQFILLLIIIGVAAIIYSQGTSSTSQKTDQITKSSTEMNKLVQIQKTDSRDTSVADNTSVISYIKKSNDENIQTSVRYDSDHTKITYKQNQKTKITFDGVYTNRNHIFRGSITVYSPDIKP